MKRLSLTIISVLAASQFSHAQWATNGNNIYNTNSGNVGIGTNSLTAKFAVYQTTALGSVAQNSLLLSSVGGSVANNVQHNIWLVRNAAGSDFTTARLHDGISIDASFLTPRTDTRTWWERDPTGDIQSWGTAANTYVTIKQGNLGIGILNPQNKLDVNGTIHSKSVLIDLNGWSDYVFKKGYQLLPLNEVKNYIDQNQHLPGIPSEEEMIKKGLNISEMNELLMKKVEELTLYLIEKDEKDKIKEAATQIQSNRIAYLERQLKYLLVKNKKLNKSKLIK